MMNTKQIMEYLDNRRKTNLSLYAQNRDIEYLLSASRFSVILEDIKQGGVQK